MDCGSKPEMVVKSFCANIVILQALGGATLNVKLGQRERKGQ
jgi:hypothetical protein